jgi:predicted DNA-binding transcriptional regulator YafY
MSSVPYEARVNLALEAIQKDQNLSIRAAAKDYGVSDRTICRQRDGSAARHDTVPNSRKLIQSEEDVIVQYVIELCI